MINKLSYVLLFIGTIGASITVARTQPEIEGWQSLWQINTAAFSVFLLMMITGIVLSKFKSNPLLEIDNEKPLPPLDEFLNNAKNQLTALSNQVDDFSTKEIYQKLDFITQDNIEPFLMNRDFLIREYGMSNYALVFTPFAQAERYLNRAWSAAVDDYKEESVTYINRAIPLLSESIDVLKPILHSNV